MNTSVLLCLLMLWPMQENWFLCGTCIFLYDVYAGYPTTSDNPNPVIENNNITTKLGGMYGILVVSK